MTQKESYQWQTQAPTQVARNSSVGFTSSLARTGRIGFRNTIARKVLVGFMAALALPSSARVHVSHERLYSLLHATQRPEFQDSSLEPFDLIFVDPPYADSRDCTLDSDLGKLLTGLSQPEILSPQGTIVLRHEAVSKPAKNYDSLELSQSRVYGAMALSFFELAGEA